MINVSNIYRSKHWASHLAKGRPIRKVSGGWMICRYSKRHRRKKVVHRVSINKRLKRLMTEQTVKPIFTISRKKCDRTT